MTKVRDTNDIDDIRVSYARLLGAEPEFTKLVLLDAQMSMVTATKYLLDVKARRLKDAVTLLTILSFSPRGEHRCTECHE